MLVFNPNIKDVYAGLLRNQAAPNTITIKPYRIRYQVTHPAGLVVHPLKVIFLPIMLAGVDFL